MYSFKSGCESDTEQIGRIIAEKLYGKEVIALYGGLGMGKTALVRGLADYFGLRDVVSSPTFAIVNEYDGRFKIYHFDMYRVNTWNDLESTGFYDYMNNAIMLIEWSENIAAALPEDTIEIEIKKGEKENERTIEVEGIDLS